MVELFRSSIFLLHTCRGPHFARGRPFAARSNPIGASQATPAQPRPNSAPGCPALLPAGRPAFSGPDRTRAAEPSSLSRSILAARNIPDGMTPPIVMAPSSGGDVHAGHHSAAVGARGRPRSPVPVAHGCSFRVVGFSGLGGHQFQLRIAASLLAGASGGLVLTGPHCAPAPPVTGDTSVGARLRSADRGDEPRMNGRAVLEVRGCATVTA